VLKEGRVNVKILRTFKTERSFIYKLNSTTLTEIKVFLIGI